MDETKIEARAAERLITGQAWDDYCETLKAAGRMIEEFGEQPSDLDRAEWYRFLTRLMRRGAERLIENGEPTRPRLRDMPWRQSIKRCSVWATRAWRLCRRRGLSSSNSSGML